MPGFGSIRGRLGRVTFQEHVKQDVSRDNEGLVHATVTYRGRTVEFCLDDPLDVVQSNLVRGHFYEGNQLRLHRELVIQGSTVLDVGANVGNHTVYYALYGAGRVYPFEPNPRPRDLLARTVKANGLDNVDLSHSAFGVGASTAELYVGASRPHNLGRTSLVARGQQQVQVRPLDSLDLAGRISLVKIDTEGMEMEVLAGAQRLIEDQRPGIAVEVDSRNYDAFWEWLHQNRYHVIKLIRAKPENENYICIPTGPRMRA